MAIFSMIKDREARHSMSFGNLFRPNRTRQKRQKHKKGEKYRLSKKNELTLSANHNGRFAFDDFVWRSDGFGDGVAHSCGGQIGNHHRF